MAEPIITWNLFVANLVIPLCLLILWGAIKRQFEKKDAKDKQIDELKEAIVTTWRDKFDATLCGVKVSMDDIKAVLHKLDNDKVTWDHCNERRRQEDQAMREIEVRLRMGGI